MNELKSHFSAQELADLELDSLPKTKKAILDKAKRENWTSKPRQGKGGGYEYSLNSLPQETQAELILKNSEKSAVEISERSEATAPQRKELNYLPEVFWRAYDRVTQKRKDKAESRFKAVCAVTELIANGMEVRPALAKTAERFGESPKSVERWYYRTKPFDRSDWLAVLVGKNGGQREERFAEFNEAAWEFFKADYLRPERPQFNACYRRLADAARENGWDIPSVEAVKRKLERDVPKIQQIYWRKGEYAVSQLYPSQKRTVADLEAMEWINGDGYQHNVFVRWHNGEIVRPKTWYWQDIRTRKILGYRTDLSENSDTIRLSLMDVVFKYGIPKHLTIDNTRAAANKWMTGGVKNRYRFKVKDDDVQGIIPTLGIELHWTSVQFGKGHGQAKPIERAFGNGGLGEIIDKHPNFAGFYAGSGVDDQPDNYNGGKDGVDYDTFILTLEAGIQSYNNQLERKTEICKGVYSFNQVFERDYALATKVRKANAEQLRMMMLMSEAVRLNKDGTFELDCGGKVNERKNRYIAKELIASCHSKVVVKFDPKDLHGKVYVYSLDMIFLAEAVCQEALAFGDKAAGREHDKARKQWVKAQKAAAKAQSTMTAQEAARYLPEVEFEDVEETEEQVWQVIKEGTALRKVEVVPDDEQEDEAEQWLMKGIAMLKEEKGL